MYVYVYICMVYVCMYVNMYVCMYVRIHVCMYSTTQVQLCNHLHAQFCLQSKIYQLMGMATVSLVSLTSKTAATVQHRLLSKIAGCLLITILSASKIVSTCEQMLCCTWAVPHVCTYVHVYTYVCTCMYV